MTKIDIISGFLGAGKTTLIKMLIKDAFKYEKVVLIENEFGEIGIDGSFLKDSGIEIKEMNSGCICCSLAGDFSEALSKVLEEFTPDRIIIEPSGVGKLSDVIKAVQDLQNPNIKLNALVSVVDGQKCRVYMKNFGEFFNNQIEYASTIIVSRMDKITEFQKEECVKMIQEINSKANLITTPYTDMNGAYILKIMEEAPSLEKELLQEESICPTCGEHQHHHHEHDENCDCHEHEHHHEHDEDCDCHHHEHVHHHAEEVFTSISWQTPKTYKEEELDSLLKELSTSHVYGHVLRAKGILPSDDNTWLYFDLVPGEYTITSGNADFTGRVCIIGSKLDKEKIENLFLL